MLLYFIIGPLIVISPLMVNVNSIILNLHLDLNPNSNFICLASLTFVCTVRQA